MISSLVKILMFMIYILLMIMLNLSKNISVMMSLVIIYVWLLLMMGAITNKNLTFVNFFMGCLIILFFYLEYLWKFYIVYELTILPMSVLILGWGMNPYRFPASFYMMIYTLFFSVPMMIMILWNYKNFFYNMLLIKNNYMNFFMSNLYMAMFLVKVPIFFLHYWLLKAHVEASTSGSIILASGLLKMGSFGIFKLMMWLPLYMVYYNMILLSAGLSSIICLLQTDFKKMVALMSVSHMSLSVSTLMVQLNSSYQSFLLFNLSHTLSSGLMFYMSGILYSMSKTRLLYNMPFTLFNLLYYLLIAMLMVNLGIPPFFSFMGEFFNLSTMYYLNLMNILMIFIYMMCTSLYSLMILNSMKVSKLKYMKKKTLLMIKLFLSLLAILWFYL